ncbi:hypothetical protein EYF80_020396 [Liparis tanakae]|uniref:Uncharacterized protein n=1 Tax=Liparis tanakae TaxID=230148 RepID=A0A4Z2HVS6_9TELE|nr:hypothetical protein EYF80_020396 [Liparis tanakae]
MTPAPLLMTSSTPQSRTFTLRTYLPSASLALAYCRWIFGEETCGSSSPTFALKLSGFRELLEDVNTKDIQKHDLTLDTATASRVRTLYLHALQDVSTFLLEDPARVLDGLSSSSPDVAHPDGHPGHAGSTRLVVLLELHSDGGEWRMARTVRRRQRLHSLRTDTGPGPGCSPPETWPNVLPGQDHAHVAAHAVDLDGQFHLHVDQTSFAHLCPDISTADLFSISAWAICLPSSGLGPAGVPLALLRKECVLRATSLVLPLAV